MERGTDQWRRQHWGTPCQAELEPVTVGRARLKVEHRAVAAFNALVGVLAAHGYDVHPAYPDGDTGAYNCRHMRHDPNLPMSAHSWGTAIDINWNSNPDGSRLVTDIPQPAIDDIHRLRTVSGAPVWRWGGDWDRDPRTGHSYYDAMHFELICTPEELAGGITNAPAGPEEDDMPVTAPEDVAYFQTILANTYPAPHDRKGPPYDIGAIDGIIGPKTEAALRDWQKRRRITVTGTLTPTTCHTLQSHSNRAYATAQAKAH